MRSDSSVEYEPERQEKSYDNYNHLTHRTCCRNAPGDSDRLTTYCALPIVGSVQPNTRMWQANKQTRHKGVRPTRTHASYPTRHPAELTGIPGIHHLQARGVTITTRADPQDATLDGEVRVQTPLQVQVADEPLNVVVPTMVEQRLTIRSSALQEVTKEQLETPPGNYT